MLSEEEIALLREIGEQHLEELIAGSFSGKTSGSDPENGGSIPSPAAIVGCVACGSPHGDEPHYCTA